MTTYDDNLEPLPGLPPELAELEAELVELEMAERPSFAPELQAELEAEWLRGPDRGRRAVARYAIAASVVMISVLGLAVAPARASLVGQLQRIFDALQPPATAVEVTLPIGESAGEGEASSDFRDLRSAANGVAQPPARTPVAAAELPPFVPGIFTWPRLADRVEAEELVRRHYPRSLQFAGIGGTVRLALWVDSTGAVDHVQMNEGSGVPALDRAALQAAPSLAYLPATRNGRPDGSWVEFDMIFTPTEDESLLPVPTDPAVPEAPLAERPRDRSEASAVPAPILLETRELLRAAIGAEAADLLQERLGPIEGILEGEPPVGANPLSWRREAVETLENAMTRDPGNPAPYLALARIRRKQGLRADARLLFERGMERAERGTRPISPRLVAELSFEHGRVTRESWLGWRGLGEVPVGALRDASCDLPVGASSGAATADDLVAWNFNCPSALHRVLERHFVPRAEAEIEADAMLASFRAAVDAWPGHVEANTEILLAMADEEAWLALLNGARRFARASQGHPNAFLMSGLALHRLGRSEEALVDFEHALALLGPRERAAFEDPSPLLANDGESAGPAFWRALDPILSTEVNERLVEHWARGAYAALRFGSLEADASRVWMRYGRPAQIRAFGSGSGIRTEFWDYGAGPDVTFHRPSASANAALTPEADEYLDDLRRVFPHMYGSRARTSWVLPARVTRFRGRMRGATELEMHFRIPAELMDGDSLSLGIFMLTPDGGRAMASRGTVAGNRSEIDRVVPVGPEVDRVVIEVWNPRLGMAAGIRVPAHSPGVALPGEGGAGMSELLLVEDAGEVARDLDRDAEGITPWRGFRVDAERIAVLFELYDLPDPERPYRLRFELQEESRGTVVAVPHRPAGQAMSGAAWLRVPLAVDRSTEYSSLDLRGVPQGRWTVRALVELPDGQVLVREVGGIGRGVDPEPTRDPGSRGGTEWQMGF